MVLVGFIGVQTRMTSSKEKVVEGFFFLEGHRVPHHVDQ